MTWHEADSTGITSGVEDRLGDHLVALTRTVRHAGQNQEHHKEHGHLSEERQARRHRVDLVLLVELHHLLVERLAVAAVLFLEARHFRCQSLHFQHSLGALQGQRGHQHHHEHGDQ